MTPDEAGLETSGLDEFCEWCAKDPNPTLPSPRSITESPKPETKPRAWGLGFIWGLGFMRAAGETRARSEGRWPQ